MTARAVRGTPSKASYMAVATLQGLTSVSDCISGVTSEDLAVRVERFRVG